MDFRAKERLICTQGINPKIPNKKCRPSITSVYAPIRRSIHDLYATKAPIIATSAAANRAIEAVDDVGVMAGAALVIDVVA